MAKNHCKCQDGWELSSELKYVWTLPRCRVKEKAFQSKRTVHLKGPEKIIDLGIFWKMKNGEPGVRKTAREIVGC